MVYTRLVLPPAGTACANHGDTPASATCGRCARAVCNSCVVFDTAGAATCTTCAAAVPGGSAVIPWERREQIGGVPAFLQTVKAVLLRPQECLAAPAGGAEIGSPLLFAVICHTIGVVFALFWQFVTMLLTTPGGGMGVGFGEMGVLSVLGILAGPLGALTWVFLWGAVVHVFLMMFGAARGGFVATARVQGYASVGSLWYAVPLLGGMVGLVWSIIIQILGLASAHGTGAGRTTAAVLAPIAICCFAMFGLIALMAVGFSSFLPDQ